MALRDAAGAERAGTPEAWRRVIRTHLTERDYEVLAPLSTSRPTLVPSALVRLVGYPLRPRRTAPEPTLEALLGIPRARILRELDRPASNNALAAVLQTVPSAATHHVSALAAAGLVVRDRSDGSLRVRRTARGDALLALYDAA